MPAGQGVREFDQFLKVGNQLHGKTPDPSRPRRSNLARSPGAKGQAGILPGVAVNDLRRAWPPAVNMSTNPGYLFGSPQYPGKAPTVNAQRSVCRASAVCPYLFNAVAETVLHEGLQLTRLAPPRAPWSPDLHHHLPENPRFAIRSWTRFGSVQGNTPCTTVCNFPVSNQDFIWFQFPSQNVSVVQFKKIADLSAKGLPVVGIEQHHGITHRVAAKHALV